MESGSKIDVDLVKQPPPFSSLRKLVRFTRSLGPSSLLSSSLSLLSPISVLLLPLSTLHPGLYEQIAGSEVSPGW